MKRSPLRVCLMVRLQPELVQEYLNLHNHVWPSVEARLRASHVHNYTIFRRGLDLVGYYEYTGKDYEADMAAIAADPETQRWWRLTNPCQVDPESDQSGGPWRPAEEVWHLEDR